MPPTTPSDFRRTWLALGKALLLANMLGIAFCGYFPFDFSFGGHPLDEVRLRFDVSTTQFYTAGDVLENILFFMPLGMSLAMLLTRVSGTVVASIFWERDDQGRPIDWQKESFGRLARNVIIATLVGAILSTCVELGQCFLGDRDSGLVDIVNNMIGTLLGAVGFALVGPIVMPPIVRVLGVVRMRLGWKLVASVAVFWAILAVLPIYIVRDFGTLARWDDRFPMSIGNFTSLLPPTRDNFTPMRPWRGNVAELSIASSDVSRQQIGQLLAGDEPQKIFGDKLIAHVDFTRAKGSEKIVDDLSNIPALEWLGTPPPGNAGREGVAIDGQHFWLRSIGPVARVTDPISASSQFTLAMTLETADREQYLPARIFTINDEELGGNNLTVGQDGPLMAVRLRARITAHSGMGPQIQVPDVFADVPPRRMQRVIVSYRPWVMSVWVNDLAHAYRLTVTPEAAIVWRLYPRTYWKFRLGSAGTEVYRAVYRALFFAPLGVLLALAARHGKWPRQVQWAIISAGVLVTAAALELVSSRVGPPGGFRWASPIISLTCAGIGAMLFQPRASAEPSDKSPQ